jgi:hypothetical protein
MKHGKALSLLGVVVLIASCGSDSPTGRQVVNIAGVSSASGVALATAQTDCVCNGTTLQPNEACCHTESPPQPYNTDTHCCTKFGVQQKYPITGSNCKALNVCPNRIQNPASPPLDNGECDGIPETFTYGRRTANFTQCCIAHDHCYSTCKPPELTDVQYRVSVCDHELRLCWERECQAVFVGPGLNLGLPICLSVVRARISTLAQLPAFITGYCDGQRHACMCCAGDQPADCATCPAPCSSIYCCDSAPLCGGTPGCDPVTTCLCSQTTEGVCHCGANLFCSDLVSCATSADCPPGTQCIPNCGCGVNKCLPACGTQALQVGITDGAATAGRRQ